MNVYNYMKRIYTKTVSEPHIYLVPFDVHNKHYVSAVSHILINIVRKWILPHVLLTYDIRHSESRYHRDACTERRVPHERHGVQIGNTGSVR